MKKLFLCMLLLSACSKKPNHSSDNLPRSNPHQSPSAVRRVNGQVFIVTQSSQNVPLALVDVKVFPLEEINSYITNAEASSQEIKIQLNRRCEDVAERIAKLQEMRPVESEKFDQNMRELNASLAGPDGKLPFVNEDSLPVKRYKQNLSFLTNLQADYKEDATIWPTSKFYFNNLPSSNLQTKSDADGRFVLNIISNKDYAIVAQGESRVDGSVETHYWMVKINFSEHDDRQILLSNHNIVSSEANESIVRCKRNSLKRSLGDRLKYGPVLSISQSPPEY